MKDDIDWLSKREKTKPEKTVLELHSDFVKELINSNKTILITRENQQIIIDPTAQLQTGDIFGYDKRYIEMGERVHELVDYHNPPCGYILKNEDGCYELWDNNGLNHKGIKSLADIGLCDSETCNKWNAANSKEKMRLWIQQKTKCGLCSSANIILKFHNYHGDVIISCNNCGGTETRYLNNDNTLAESQKCEVCGTTNTKEWGTISSYRDWNLPKNKTLKLGEKTLTFGDNEHYLCIECYIKYEIKIEVFERNVEKNSDQYEEQAKRRRLSELKKMAKTQLIEIIIELEKNED